MAEIINLTAARLKRSSPSTGAGNMEGQIRSLIREIAADLGINLEAEAAKRRRAEEQRIERIVAARVRKITGRNAV